jgi:hypothetical protein
MVVPNITGFGPVLIKLAMQLSICAYEDDFSKYNGTILYANRDVGFEVQVFYVYSLDSALWIVNRGAEDFYDFLSCGDFNETTTPSGTFHLGAYNSAIYTLNYALDYIKSFDGPIYCTGHSYGGTVAPVVAVLASDAYPDKDISSIAFAGIPMMDDATNAKHHEKLVMIVNDVDIVPTLSVPNLYDALALLIPFIQDIDEDQLVNFLEGLLDDIWIFLPTELYDALKEDIVAIADAVIAYSHGEQRLIRYVPGHAYQLEPYFPKKLADCEVDPKQALNTLSLNPLGFLEHNAGSYETVVEELPSDSHYWFRLW